MARLKLYDDFAYLQEQGTIWLFSDPHFNDPESKLLNPNWPDADTIVKNINSKVGTKDTLIILGDLGDEDYVRKLKGDYKILITGNHDRGSSNYKKKEDFIILTREEEKEYLKDPKAFVKEKKKNRDFKRIIEAKLTNESDFVAGYSNDMFDYVYDGPLFISSKILLSHEPIRLPFGINIHGHSHLTDNGYYVENEYAGVNICCDMTNFEPVRLDKIVEKYKVQTLHKLTVENAKVGVYDE